MKFINKLVLSLLMISATFSISIAKEGVAILSKTKDLKSNTVTNSSVYVSDTKVAIDNAGKMGSTIIFDANKELFTYVDNGKKEYYQFDKATLVQLKAQVKMFAQMMKQFANQMPEDQRKKLDKILNPSAGGTMSYTKAQGTEKVKSWTTDRYEGKKAEEKVMSIYIASYQSVGVDEVKFNAMKKMLSFAEENLQEISSLLPASGGLSGLSFDSNGPIMNKGIPVKMLTYENSAAINENTVESVKLMDLPDSKFNIPPGYTRKTIDIQNQLGK